MKAEINKIGKHRFYEIRVGEFSIDGLMNEKEAQKVADKFNSALEQHVQSELSKTNAGYWKERCLAAEYVVRIRHWTNASNPSYEIEKKWETLKTQPEPSSELSTKIEQIEKELNDEWIRTNTASIRIEYAMRLMRTEILKILKA